MLIDSIADLANPLLFSQTTIVLEDIKNRPYGDTRRLNIAHAEELSDSIAVVGLIQPLVIDKNNHLLAGGHRRAALFILQKSSPQIFEKTFPRGKIPVLVIELDASCNMDQAIAIEAAENEKRRDYTPAEVRILADRLIAAGYQQTRGKPKQSAKALQPALASIIGKSTRTVQRYLKQTDQAPPLQKDSVYQTSVVIKKLIGTMKQFENLSEQELQAVSQAGQLQQDIQRLRKQLELLTPEQKG